jgi:hypothetical protein
MQPDETLQIPGIDEAVVELGGFTVAKVVQEPGWVCRGILRRLIGSAIWSPNRPIGATRGEGKGVSRPRARNRVGLAFIEGRGCLESNDLPPSPRRGNGGRAWLR